MTKIRIGDTLSLLDGEWVVEGMQGGSLRLRNVYDQQMQVLHVTALPRLLATPPQIKPDAPGPRTFDTITDRESKIVAERARHVEEVIYGKPRGAEIGRPDYDPETTGLLERQLLKATELKASGQDVSPRTMRRWVQAYRQGGPAGLLAWIHRRF